MPFVARWVDMIADEVVLTTGKKESAVFAPDFKPPTPPPPMSSSPNNPVGALITGGAQSPSSAVGIERAAGSIIGGALGSFLPGPGNAIGAAIGGAVAPAVVDLVGDVAKSIGSFFGGLF